MKPITIQPKRKLIHPQLSRRKNGAMGADFLWWGETPREPEKSSGITKFTGFLINGGTWKLKNAARKPLGRELEKRVEWLVVFKSKLAITGKSSSIAVLTSVCCMVVCWLLPAHAQSIMDPSIASSQADTKNPSLLVQTNATEQRIALSFNEDFSPGSSFALVKDQSQVDKPSGRPDIRAGYGQFFSAQNRARSSTSRIEAPGRLYLKLSFKF